MSTNIDKIRAFNRFYTNFLGLLNHHFLDMHISLTDCRILFEIDALPGCRAKELMDILRINRGYLSRTLSRLEASGYLEKRLSSSDGRAKNLALTVKGGELLAELNHKAHRHIQQIIKNLSKTDQNKLVSAMQTIESILSRR